MGMGEKVIFRITAKLPFLWFCYSLSLFIPIIWWTEIDSSSYLLNGMEMMSSDTLNTWLDQLDMEEFIGECLVDYSPEFMGGLTAENLHYSPSPVGSDCNSSTATTDVVLNTNSPKRQKLDNSPLPPVLGLESSNKDPEVPTVQAKKPRRHPEQCHNHIIAERQRRQTLSQRFIAMSALIPGLKKMDKTSVLGEAINHMKQLKEKLKTLEEENSKRAVESVVVVKRSQVIVENQSGNSNSDSGSDSVNVGSTTTTTYNNNNNNNKQLPVPEIEVRFSNKNVLLKIHCKMQKGVLVKLMTKIESLHLSVSSTHAMPFSAATSDITIMAQMEAEFDLKAEDVVKVLRSVFQ